MSSILGKMAPTALAGGEAFIVLKAYYDGGNKADTNLFKVLTLAGYAATESIWDRLDIKWKAVLAKHGAEYMHMKEAMPLEGAFKEWCPNKVEALLVDLISLLRDFREKPILGVSCTVVLADYKAAMGHYLYLPRPEHACMILCLEKAFVWYINLPRANGQGDILPKRCADIWFDRGEEFYGYANDAWNHKKLRTRPTFQAVRTLAQTDMREVPGLQMADMLAWAHNRPYGEGGFDALCVALRTALPEAHKLISAPQLANINIGRLAEFRDLNLPRRKRMR